MRYNPNANQLYSLTRLDATNIYGTIQTAAQPNITSVGTTSLNVSGDGHLYNFARL